VTGIAQAVFPHQANGSVIERQGKALGSELIGQPFDNPGYFWSRPSATTPQAYNAGSSTGSNLGTSNPAQTDAVTQRVAALKAADPGNAAPVPVDLVTASASGLDPQRRATRSPEWHVCAIWMRGRCRRSSSRQRRAASSAYWASRA
jgi:K+-transporting ATPase ATPase C chain